MEGSSGSQKKEEKNGNGPTSWWGRVRADVETAIANIGKLTGAPRNVQLVGALLFAVYLACPGPYVRLLANVAALLSPAFQFMQGFDGDTDRWAPFGILFAISLLVDFKTPTSTPLYWLIKAAVFVFLAMPSTAKMLRSVTHLVMDLATGRKKGTKHGKLFI